VSNLVSDEKQTEIVGANTHVQPGGIGFFCIFSRVIYISLEGKEKTLNWCGWVEDAGERVDHPTDPAQCNQGQTYNIRTSLLITLTW